MERTPSRAGRTIPADTPSSSFAAAAAGLGDDVWTFAATVSFITDAAASSVAEALTADVRRADLLVAAGLVDPTPNRTGVCPTARAPRR